MANERASLNVTEAANQVMNIDNATRMYAKGIGGGGIPPLVAHAHAVDTRCSFFSPPPPAPLSAWVRGYLQLVGFPAIYGC